MNSETPTLTRAQLKSAIDDPTASPQSRLSAANLLIDSFGLSDRNRRLAKRTAKRFSKFISDSQRSQVQVRFQAEKLLARIERALENSIVQPDDAIEENDEMASLEEQQSPATKPKSIIGNTEMLPPDADDDYWDFLISGRSRRQLFLMLWELDPTLSRSGIIAAISDPARIESNTLRLHLWACSRAQLDEKFQTDEAIVRAALAERGLEDSDAGRDELARQVEASGQPLVEFKLAENDPDGAQLPVLVRTEAGQLLDAIAFVASWPLNRSKHQAL